ncbi:uncharacterized protein JCM15063_000086 [Sporobolomyces koalae]|uniref:uncharacterized protein n=1 Tax=Sporobolomyces koalae TaxID=500713 RepID=UPI00316B2021
MSLARLPVPLIARSIRPTVVPHALAARTAAVLATPSTRLLSTSSPLADALAASAGSGQGGKAEKEAAKKARAQAAKEREHAKKEREKERARKDKEKARLLKEREKLKAQKAKDKAAQEKDKAKAKLAREKAKLAKAKENKPKTVSVLRPPKAPTNSWGIFLTEYIAEHKRNLGPGEKLASVTELAKSAGAEYATLGSASKAELQHRADEQRAAYPAILEAWKKTLTPEMIREENVVRANRRKLGLSRKHNLKMDGEPKRPRTAYFLFLNEQHKLGPDSEVLQGETRVIEQSKLLAAAWRALPESEKKRFEELYAQDKARYEKEKAEFDAKHAATS